jgi:hypothetical protein
MRLPYIKILVIFCLVIFCQDTFSQVYQLMPQYGYQAPRMKFDSTLQIPTVCGVPTLKSVQFASKSGAIAFDSCNNRFYTYNPKTLTWSQVSGGGGSTDTTSLSTRIDARVKYTDTTSMLSPYLRKVDTSNAFVNSVTKLNDSTIQVIKGASTTNITLTTSSIVTAATRLVTTVYNNTGATITKGSVVYISGRHSSNLPTVALAQGNNEENSYKTFALVSDDIATGNQGTVIQAGNISGLNLPTSSYTDGDVVFLSPTVAGGITTTKPLAPYHICKIGSVTRAHPSAGSIEIKIENGWQLDELSDVSIPVVPADSVVLQFSRVDSLWHDVTITNAIGTRYIKPADTASLSSRINSKLTISDTSTLQPKQLAAYSFQANGTSAAANGTATYFKDTSGTYTGSIAWTGTTAPSGTTNHSYRWTRIGKCVTLNVNLIYATNGGALTAVVFDLPSDAPTPAEPAGLTGASQNMYPVLVWNTTATNTLVSNAARGFLRNNSSNNAYEFVINITTSAVNSAYVTINYWTN